MTHRATIAHLCGAAIGAVAALAACARPARVALTPFVDDPVGWACTRADSLPPGPPGPVTRLAMAARELRIRPVVVDTGGGRLIVAGPEAPRGRGDAPMREARLYIRFLVARPDSQAPGSAGASAVITSPGVWRAPPGLSAEQRRSLYRQADSMSVELVRRSGGTARLCDP